MSAPIHMPAPANTNVEAEAALIAGLLTNNAQIDRCGDILGSDDFSDEFFRHVFGLIIDERAKGHHVSPVTLRPFVGDENAKILIRLTGDANAGHVLAHQLAEQVADLAKRRRLTDAMEEASSAANNHAISVDELAAGIETALAEALRDDAGSQSIGAGASINALLNAMNEPDRGVTCGNIGAIDATLGKLRPKQLVIVAGRPAQGKTTMAQSYALGAANKGHGVLFVSLEMSAEQLSGKFASDLLFDTNTRVPYSAIEQRCLATNQIEAVRRAAAFADDLPLEIEDVSSVTIGKLNRMVRRHARRFQAKGTPLELVIVDYLQLVRPDQRERDPYAAISEVSRGLKQIAKQNGVAVMALAQLSREVEKRADKRPILADLRDSGQIEQDADSVMFLLRREEYLRREEPDAGTPDWFEWRSEMDKHEGKIEFIVAKRRAGCTGIAEGKWHGAFQAVRG